MSEQTVQAAPSAAELDVFEGRSPSVEEFTRYREDPASFQTHPADTADPAPAEPLEDTASEGEPPESDPEAEPEDEQEKPAQPKKLTAKERIAQLEATIEELWQQEKPDALKIAQLNATIEKIERGAGIKRKAEVAPVTQPKQPEAPTPQQPQYTRPKPTAEDKDEDGNPKYATYEDFVEDLADWKAEQRWVSAERQRAAQARSRELQEKLEEARERYENFDEVMRPALAAIAGDQDVSPVVTAMLNDSEVLPDLLFTLGSDENDLHRFLADAKSNPGRAIRTVALIEGLIHEELAKGDESEPKKTPAKPQSSAPKPPSPVSGGNSRAFDVSDESLSPEDWMRKRNQDLQKRGTA